MPDEIEEVEELSTDDGHADGGRAAAREHLPELAGATSMIAEQLSTITEEMNRLKAELYSDSGLGSIKAELDALRTGGLEQIQAQVQQLENESGAATTGACTRRPAAAAKGALSRGSAAGASSAGRGVSFAPDTRDVARRHGESRSIGRRPQPRGARSRDDGAGGGASWTPYVVGAVIICIGPARPLLMRLLEELLGGSLWAAREPTPWYDQVDE